LTLRLGTLDLELRTSDSELNARKRALEQAVKKCVILLLNAGL
jgi:hypothetical protein